jgi:hypothetical protein
MVEELSALDAELDQLGVESASDSAALASSYAVQLGALSEVDAGLTALATGLNGELAPARAFSLLPPRSERTAAPDSAEISLAGPIHDAADESGELPLDDDDAPQSGAFALPPDAATPDEPLTEDLTFEADIEELVEFDEPDQPLFDSSPGRISETDRLVDAEFAELFADVPSEPGSYEDDTELSDSSALAAIKAKGELEPIENAFNAEELDSAEFEIVLESTDERTDRGTSTTPPSIPPEKRPSFLGRLFGRKDE